MSAPTLPFVGPGIFSTGKDSPVNADWLTNKSLADITRASAGVMSPAERKITSPGTMSGSLISCLTPSLSTVAVEVTFCFSSCAAFSALLS